jgi:hypothetical protein
VYIAVNIAVNNCHQVYNIAVNKCHQVYNKKASLLEGDLEEVLERIQQEVGGPSLHSLDGTEPIVAHIGTLMHVHHRYNNNSHFLHILDTQPSSCTL